MDGLDWQTEEEGPVTPGVRYPARRYPRRWLLVAVFIFVAAAIGAVIWQLGRRAEIQEKNVKEDVLAAFGIWQKAVDTRDEELLATLLMDGEPAWTAIQKELLSSGRLLDRSAVGLTMVKTVYTDDDHAPTVHISDDWRAAEIRFPVSYRPFWSSKASDVAQLEHTASLVREGSRWLLRRPEEDFWGTWQTGRGRLATVAYRLRDKGFAEQLIADLDSDLGEICERNDEHNECLETTKLPVRLESDVAVLLNEADQNTPEFSGRAVVLPSPTLMGKPQDDAGYRILYSAYTGPILKTFNALLAAPVRISNQDVAMICYSRDGTLPNLYRYNPAEDQWSVAMQGSAIRYLTSNDADSRLAIQEYIPRQPNRLRIVQADANGTRVLHDETYVSLTSHGFGYIESDGGERLMLVTYQGTMRIPLYQIIEVGEANSFDCSEAYCPLQTLGSYPIWSPGGGLVLLQREGQVLLADGDGNIRYGLGEGYSPFWLDKSRFGFIRPRADRQGQHQEIVLGTSGEQTLAVYWSTADLDLNSSGMAADKPFFIQHAAVAGGQPGHLLVYGRQYDGDNSRFAFLSLPLPAAKGDYRQTAPITGTRLELLLDRTPAGFPSVASPIGHVPLVVSPDGRWLTTAHLAAEKTDVWRIHVVEIGSGEQYQQYSLGYPGYSFSHPFFDWSADGQWLLMIDDDFIRLAAPGAGFERIIAHDYNTCSYPSWINRYPA